MNRHSFLSIFLTASAAFAQAPVEAVRVVSQGSVERRVKLPGEFRPYLNVPIHAKVTGFVDKVEVDLGSDVKKGQVLAVVVAPEMEAQIAEAQSKVQAVQLRRSEAEAKEAAAQSTYDRLKAASATPGIDLPLLLTETAGSARCYSPAPRKGKTDASRPLPPREAVPRADAARVHAEPHACGWRTATLDQAR